MLFNSLTVPGSESKLLNSYCAESRGGGGGGVFRISRDRDDRRIFLGLKIFDFGMGRKILTSTFLGSLI